MRRTATTTLLNAPQHRLRILQIVGNAIVGGMERGVERLIKSLPPERYGVTVISPFDSPLTDRLRAVGADVITTAVTDEPSWRSIQLASALVRAGAIDLIHTHLPNAHVLGGIVGRLTDRPVLATIHGRQVTPIDLEVHLAAKTHLAVVCRQSHLHALGVGANPLQLHWVPNGIDTDAFAPGKPRRGELRDAMGIDEGPSLVGFVGRLSWEKGPDLFLQMALQLRARRPGVRFVMVGEGPMRAELETFIDRFDLGPQVHLAGLRTAMPEALAELDIVVSPSRSEAMPLALMEAMASGLPVVACKVGGVADLVQHGVTGWLVDEGDCEDLVVRTVELLDDAAGRAAAGRAARERAVAGFDARQSVEAMMKLYERLIASNGELNRLAAVAQCRPVAVESD